PLPRHEAGLHLERKFMSRIALRAGEAAYTLGREVDVTPHGAGNLTDTPFDVLGRHDDRTRPAIEFGGVVTHGLLAVLRDLGEHRLDDRARVRRLTLRRPRGPFQILDRHVVRPRDTLRA